MKPVGLVLLVAFCSVQARSRSNVEGFPVSSHRGLVFEAGLGPHVSASGPSFQAGYIVFMGAGYNFTSQLALELRVYTGSEMVQRDVTRPVTGLLPLGGGGLRATFFLVDGSEWRPFVAGGFELITLLGQSGYNGGGPHIAGGIQRDLSKYFALAAEVQYSLWRFYNLVRLEDANVPFSPFIDSGISVCLSISFYPNILP